MIVYGTRPEAIKMAPVISALQADPRFTSLVVSTGQHREMLDQVNKRFGIQPDYDLDLMMPGQGLNTLVSRTIAGLDPILEREAPDAILVHGDTSTALAAALSGFHREAHIVHVEAGLRTNDLSSPFPEEANRRIISQISSLHLAPTSGAMENLRKENVRSRDIVVTGNTVIDSLLASTEWEVTFDNPELQSLVDSSCRVILVTTHRRENLGGMGDFAEAIATLARNYSDDHFVLPLHLNPAVREQMIPRLKNIPNIMVTPPLPYDQFTALMNRSDLVLTDSGGVQEVAPSLGKPVFVLREKTERPEAVLAGCVKLVGTNADLIVAKVEGVLDHPAAYDAMANAVNPYGDGRAAERSVAAIAELLDVGKRIEDFSSELAMA